MRMILEDEDNVVFEVGLTKWLKELDNMKINISWPPRSAQSSALKKEMDASPSWPTYNVIVLKFYNMLLAARNGLNGFIMSPAYETDVEVGRGKRKKIERRRFSFDSPEKQITKKTRKIPSSDSSDSNPDDPEISQFSNKTNVAAPPLVSYKPQNNKTESQRNIMHGENIKTKIFEKNPSTKTIMSTSLENKNLEKSFCLQK